MIQLGLPLVVGLAALTSLVQGHGRLASPQTRDQVAGVQTHLMNAPTGLSPNDADFLCRGYPAATPTIEIATGASMDLTWNFEAPHVGDCSVYLSYDDNKNTPSTWFKIADYYDCKSQNLQAMPLTIPSYLPACDHCVLRWEWYALHVRPTIEYYAQCIDIKITRATAGGQLPAPLVTIPGHLPTDGNDYRNAHLASTPQFITGPEIATIAGATIPPSNDNPAPAGNPTTGNNPTTATGTATGGNPTTSTTGGSTSTTGGTTGGVAGTTGTAGDDSAITNNSNDSGSSDNSGLIIAAIVGWLLACFLAGIIVTYVVFMKMNNKGVMTSGTNPTYQ